MLDLTKEPIPGSGRPAPKSKDTKAATAARVRRHRERRAAGVRTIKFDLYASGIPLLIDLGWLSEDKRDDGAAIEAAFGAFVAQAADLGVAPDWTSKAKAVALAWMQRPLGEQISGRPA